MAPPLGLVCSGVKPSSFCQASTTEANASLISATSMSPMDRPVRSSRRWVASMGPVSMSTGSTPTRQVSTIRARARRPSASARSAVISSTAAAPSEICDEEPAVWTPSGRATGLSVASFSSVVSRRPSSRATVWVVPVGLPSSSTSGASTGTIWLPKRSSAHAGGGVLLGPEAELVGVAPGDAPLLGDALGALELRGHLVLREVGAGDRDAEAEVLAAAGADRDPAHRPRRRRRRPTSTTPLPTRAVARLVACWDEPHWVSTVVLATAEGQAGGEPGGAADVEGLLADLAHAAGDDLADVGGVDPGALDHGLLDGGQEVGGVDGGQAAVALPDGGADGFDDHDIRHGGNLLDRAVNGPRGGSAVAATGGRLEDQEQSGRPMKATKIEPRSSSSNVPISSPVAQREAAPRPGRRARRSRWCRGNPAWECRPLDGPGRPRAGRRCTRTGSP